MVTIRLLDRIVRKLSSVFEKFAIPESFRYVATRGRRHFADRSDRQTSDSSLAANHARRLARLRQSQGTGTRRTVGEVSTPTPLGGPRSEPGGFPANADGELATRVVLQPRHGA